MQSTRKFMSVKETSRLFGIGEKKLRLLLANHEIEYIANGNRRLLTEEAVMDWYNRTKSPVRHPKANNNSGGQNNG